MPTNRRVPTLETFTYQQPVFDKDLNTPPVTPVEGDRYIVGPVPTGAWTGHAGKITYFYLAVWNFDVPAEGWLTHVNDEDKFYRHTGAGWVLMPQGDMTKAVYDTNDNGVVDAAGNFVAALNAVVLTFP